MPSVIRPILLLAAVIVVGVAALAAPGNPASFDAPAAEAGGPDPSTVGQWSAPVALDNVAVNAILMANGKVLYYTFGGESFVFDPATNTSAYAPQFRTNLFCSGNVPLPNGKILITGGDYQALGTTDVNIFDPANNSWTPADSMHSGRWYPTSTVLGDGRVLTVSGAETCRDCFAQVPEVYDYVSDTWTQLPGATANIPMYPHMFVLGDGRVLITGTSEVPLATMILDVNSQSYEMVDSRLLDGGSSTMYAPGKFLKAGTSTTDVVPGTASNTTYVLDMNAPSPAWRQTANMANSRAFLNLTTLPDGNVLTTGGDTTRQGVYPSTAVYEAEMWSPTTETWTPMASATRPRLYHSTALLLPDGRVMVAGGGYQLPAPDQRSAEFYSPPYLFRGPRPTISSAPTSPVNYGSSFFVGTPDGADIASVSLVRTGAVTHAFDQNARFVPLNFTQTGGGLNVTAPANSNLAPPGDYMLFILNSDGVPSIARFVRFPAGPVGPTPTPTATNTPGPGATATNTPSPTATNTPGTGGSATFGITSDAGINDSSNNGYVEGSNFALAQAGTLQSLSIYIGAVGGTNPKVRLALYSNSGDQPGSRLAESAEFTPVQGWNTVPIPGGPALAAGEYWILAQVNERPTVFRYVTGQPSNRYIGWTPAPFGPFPASITTSFTRWSGYSYLLNGTVGTPGGGPTNTPTNTPTATFTAVPTATNTLSPTATRTNTPTATHTPSATATETNTPTATSTSAATATNTTVVGPSNTPTATATATRTPTATATATSTALPPTNTPTAIPTATNTPGGGGSATFGITADTGINDSSNNGFIEGSNFALAQAGTLQSLSIYLGTANGPNPRVRLALYSDSGGSPGTRLVESVEFSPVQGWNTVPIPAGPSLAAGEYWILAQVNVKQTVFRYVTGQPSNRYIGWTPAAFGPFPASITTSFTRWSGYSYLMHGTIATAGGPTNTPTNTPPPAPTNTATATATRTNTPTATASATSTLPPTATNTPTPVPTATNTSVAAATNTASATPTRTATPTNTATATSTPTRTATPTPTATNTLPPTPTSTPTAVPTATNTPGGGGSSTFGITANTGINDSSNNGYVEGSNFTLAQAGTLQSLSIYIGAVGGTNPRVRLALYSDAGQTPGTRLAESIEFTPVQGWNTVPISGGPSLSAGEYWILAQVNVRPTVFRYITGQPSNRYIGWTAAPFGPFPASITTSFTRWSGYSYLMHGTVSTP